MEIGGASDTWLHSLGAFLVASRISHYLQITGLVGSLAFRVSGMIGTYSVYAIGAIWLLVNVAT